SPEPAPDCAEDPASLAAQAESLVAAGTPSPDELVRARDCVRRARLASPSLALALRGADLAAAASDTDDEARLLEIAAKEAPDFLSPVERLVLARQAEARGDRRGAILQYGHVLAALERRGRLGADWIGENIRRLDAEDEARKLPARSGFAPPSADARRAFADGKTALRRRATEPARDAFRKALRLSPGYSEAALALGSVEERDGRTAEAAAAYRTALAADPDGFEAVLALANLLWNEPDRSAKEESLALLDRAAALRPDQPRLQREAASRWAAWGDPARALERLEAWWPIAAQEERAGAAAFRERLRASLSRAGGPGPASLGSDPASPALGAFRLAQVYAGRPDQRNWEAAESELARAERLDPLFAPALELRAALRERRGDLAGAEEVLKRAVAADPSRTAAWERLAELLSRQSGRARDAASAWESAEQAGSREALFALARIASGEGRSSRAAGLYRRYLAEAAGGVHAEEAQAALEREERRQGTFRGAAVGAGALALLAGGLSWARRRMGLTLEEWLKRDPGATRDVRSVAGRLSHEAFKHGGLLLGEAVERLDSRGGLAEAAPLLVERLYGTSDAKGLVAEARAALSDLEALGRRRGVRLNLRFKDRLLAPVSRSLDALGRVERDLARIAGTGLLSGRRLEALGRTLREAAAVLSPRTAQLLTAELDAAGSTEVRFERLASLLASVAREKDAPAPLLAGLGLFAAPGDGKRVRVRVPEGDWNTLWRNLFVNALQTPRLALFGEERRDPVTGQALARFVLFDGDPRLLTAEMIRGRAAERGLGVVADLVRKWDGLVDVTPGTGEFTKGVAVEFAAVEEAA
ncbi:MAG TPA: tetratricopeptide repeat protein, partial [Thermoanaerobaculia bacterium]|nr:tetratricopeptide repeat protein [Thermoanaerobaculia bacterium]